MSHLLGTLWFVLLVAGVAFVAGAFLRPVVSKWIPSCCKKGCCK